MTRRPSNPGSWPRLMRAETAAAYVDERSVETFRRRIGSVYPHPVNVSGRGGSARVPLPIIGTHRSPI